jgi:nucleoside-diphosphate-sugar epimerase
MKTILITGASGFLGSELVTQLSQDTNYQIIALSRNKEKIKTQFQHIDRCICYSVDEWKQGKLPMDKVDTVIHCAFARSFTGFELSSSLLFTTDILEFATTHKVSSFINVSSRSVYGQNDNLPWTEKTPAMPDNLYALAKYSSELLTNSTTFLSNNQIYSTNIRLAGLTGLGYDDRITSKFVHKAFNNNPIIIVGGKQTFSYLDVRDAAEGIISLLKIPAYEWERTYNLGHTECYTITDIARIVSDVSKQYIKTSVKIEIQEKDVFLYSKMDSNLFYQTTGWWPKYDMKAIIESLFSYHILKLNN